VAFDINDPPGCGGRNAERRPAFNIQSLLNSHPVENRDPGSFSREQTGFAAINPLERFALVRIFFPRSCWGFARKTCRVHPRRGGAPWFFSVNDFSE
jgi:hypothetical protein